jgi:CRISPR-associated endonuclease Csn1
METKQKLRYRLGIDLGTSSLGWAMLRLDKNNKPCAVIRAGVRIFSDGRDPKTKDSLAVQRRLARQMRRTRDRKIRRRNRLIADLVRLGFFPQDEAARRQLERLDPYALRAKGLDEPLTPGEFARALFHLAQRRGFKSNRKTDARDKDSSVMKSSIKKTRQTLVDEGCRTIGEWLNKRHKAGLGTRTRLRSEKVENKTVKIYDLYLDRDMVHDEFNALWESQRRFNPELFNDDARETLQSTIFFQRDLRPVVPGRCTLIPEEPRAPLALPSQQRFRIYQEVNNLRKLDANLGEVELTLQERDRIVDALEKNSRRSFAQIKKLIGYTGDFNLEDERRTELKGNATSAVLGKKLKSKWFGLTESRQDEVVEKLLETESEEDLIAWLKANLGIDTELAEELSDLALPAGYGSLSKKALSKILPVLKSSVITYDKAVVKAGFESHSALSHMQQTGEILQKLPYYGEYLQRHVGFGTGKPEDPPEKRFGKIANPTVHIALNQTRVVVNALIQKYGRPTEIIIEVARDLKQSREQRLELLKRQAENEKQRERIRHSIAHILGCPEDNVKEYDIKKWVLWEELNPQNQLERMCPYSGKQISAAMLFTGEVEIEHILPYARTLDDSMANKTVCIREANRIKGNRTPWEAREDFAAQGWNVEGMLARAERMPGNKRFRFGEHGYATWLGSNEDFTARALNDTRYISRIACEYLSLICPRTRSIPGQLTAKLRREFGLNSILSDTGKKNRNDHRHHAVDACVIAVTDQGTLQKVATASAKAGQEGANRLIARMPLPWESYANDVGRAVLAVRVSHKPDHSYEGCMMDQTARGIRADGFTVTHKIQDGKRVADYKKLQLIPIASPNASYRHGVLPDGSAKPYKGYSGNSNFCIEIEKGDAGKWTSNVVSTYQAYQIVREKGKDALYGGISQRGKPLAMRLMKGDLVSMIIDEKREIFIVNKIRSDGLVFLSPIHEANVDARDRDKDDEFKYIAKAAGSLQKAKAHRVTISPIGDVRIH